MGLLTKTQVENIQIDYGIIYVNYGEVDARKLAPTRGGGTFTVTKTLRDIEFDGRKGKTKGMQVIDDIDATLAVSLLDTSMENLSLAMPFATLEGDGGVTPYSIKVNKDNVGIIPDTCYLKNITMFAKTVKGEYKKVTLYNAMTVNDFSLAAAPKAEGEIALEVSAHWDDINDTDLYKIEDVANIS